MLKMWRHISSINVRKVICAAQELGLPFERVDAGSEFGSVKTPAYLTRNPNALVPLLHTGSAGPTRCGRGRRPAVCSIPLS